MYHHSYSRRNIVVVAALVVLGASFDARAAILQIDARISAAVQQFDSGDPSSSDSAIEEFRSTSASLPIQASASLLEALQDGSESAFGAVAFSDFRDPTQSAVANPGEFGLEANVFSLDLFVNFEATADVVERRRVLFNATELESIEGETEREVSSGVFISGAVLMWTLDPTRDFSGTAVDFDITVTRELEGEAAETVLSSFATAAGQANGEIAFSATEGIVARVGGAELLTTAIGPLGSQLEQELEGLGRVHLILIPEQELNYRYLAPLDVEFDLVANLSVTSTNLPAGTGAGAVFGRSFQELAQVIAEFVGRRTDGTLTQRAMNKALSDLQSQDQGPDGGEAAVQTRTACGLLGMQIIALPLALMGLRLLSRRRKSAW